MAVARFVLAAGEMLQHVSRCTYRGTSLHFGTGRIHRYDDPGRSFGVLYLGFDLATVLLESVFHKHQWHRGARRTITTAEVDARMVRAVGTLDDVVLADLTAPGVMAREFGLNLSQLASRRYTHTQRISRQIHDLVDDDGKPIFDGLLYPSRNNYPNKCCALFDRASPKVACVDDIDLADHAEWPGFVSDHAVAVVRIKR